MINKKISNWVAIPIIIIFSLVLVGMSVKVGYDYDKVIKAEHQIAYNQGYQKGQDDFQPQVITETIEVPVIEYREKLVQYLYPYPVYRDKVVFRDIYRPTIDFQSLEEFQQFVEPIGIVIVWDGKCYDAALYYWQRAYEQGKRVYLDSVYPDEYNYWFTQRWQSPYQGHIVISAYIGKQIYWVDPASAEIVLRGELLK